MNRMSSDADPSSMDVSKWTEWVLPIEIENETYDMFCALCTTRSGQAHTCTKAATISDSRTIAGGKNTSGLSYDVMRRDTGRSVGG